MGLIFVFPFYICMTGKIPLKLFFYSTATWWQSLEAFGIYRKSAHRFRSVHSQYRQKRKLRDTELTGADTVLGLLESP